MITLSDLDLKAISPEKLGEILMDAKKAYYTTGKPIMDDPTYDTLEEILKQKAPYHRFFTKIGNANFDTGFDKKKHSIPMGSLNKVNNFTDLVHYFELRKTAGNVSAIADYVVQPKCDGLSLEIEYKNGLVVDAITRGDGIIGDVITQNVVKMQNFKEKLKDTFTGSIRYEIVVTYKDFKKLNNLVKKNEGFYSNPRNAASGISQRLDSKFSELCTLYAVDIFFVETHHDASLPSVTTESAKINYLDSLGIKAVDTHQCSSFENIKSIYQKYLTEDREKYDFDIDGLVIKINDLEFQQKLGVKDNRPKGQIAYKFPARTNQTRIISINWQTGPLGTVTPVAQVDPIEVSGAIITFASLANYDLVKKMEVNIGDIVEISRRGDVIPHIEKVVTKVTPGFINPPQNCPVCGTKLLVSDKYIRCPDILCPAQTLGCLRLFCDTLEIKGISTKTIEKLNKVGLVKLPGDFYKLTVADFINLDGLGEKSGKNIIAQIQAKRVLTVVEVFDAAIIPNFSAARIKQVIAAGFNTPEKILNLKISDLEPLPGFQITLATKIVEGINLRRQVIESILSQVSIKNFKLKIKNLALQGLSFAITGDLSQPRTEVQKDIETAGGKVISAVSSNTSYLVTNETGSNSSKFQTAKKLGVKIISESQLYDLIHP